MTDQNKKSSHATDVQTGQIDTAKLLALAAATDRDDCDIEPCIIEVQRTPLTDGTFVVEVDVQYTRCGYRALYGYRERDGDLSLYQD